MSWAVLEWGWFVCSVLGLIVRCGVLLDEVADWRLARKTGGIAQVVAENALLPSLLSATILLMLVAISGGALLTPDNPVPPTARQLVNLGLLSLIPLLLAAKAIMERVGRYRIRRWFAAHIDG